MGCSHPKEFRTGLRNILAFLKVELQHFFGGTQEVLLRLPGARGLRGRFYYSEMPDMVKQTTYSTSVFE